MSFVQPYELRPWTAPNHYFGDDLPAGWHQSIMDSCMSCEVVEVNFSVFLARLGGESDTVKVHQIGFSGDGWYKFVAIHESNKAAMELAKSMLESLREHPVLDDDALDAFYVREGWVQDDDGQWMPAPLRADSTSHAPV